MQKLKGTTPTTIAIPLPADIFDTEGGVIYRAKRISAARIDALRMSSNSVELYENLAVIYPRWEGVTSAETGEPLPNPEDDPTVFNHLDALEQLPWISEQLRPGGK